MRRPYLTMNDEQMDPIAQQYWPAHTALRVGRFKVSYCELMQYLFGIGLVTVIVFVVIGAGRDLKRSN